MKIRLGHCIGLTLALLAPGSGSVLADSGKKVPAPSEPKLFSFADIVRNEKPAVVNISTTQKTAVGEGGLPEDHPPLGDFFGNILPKEFNGQSLGSGFIIKKNGLILTNNHVIEKADKIIVRLSDEREFEAKVVGRDEKTDLALIKISDHQNLPTARLGDSDQLDVGEWVVAIGNPFGLEQTVTVGIVSAKGRNIGDGPFDDYIQTDASINPGNSGGPLFNIKGEVIGINTAINPSGQGIGFAIPINQVKKVLDQLETYGKITRGWLGVMIQELNEDLARSFKLKNKNGALISDVFENSPAFKAGLQRGDVIVEFDGKRITQMRTLPLIVAETPIGKEVKLKTVRDGKERTFTVRIGPMEEKEGKK
ncbi:MAG TPA: Do family serine endopeptidase [Nitrospiria bacterium]|nr:Do family serine endopeptidase [Nitrospiria bacterium]